MPDASSPFVVQVGERISLAGQIALIPQTLALPSPSSFPTEAALSLKHVRSIVKALKEGTGGGWESEFVEGCIGWVLDFERDLEGARKAWSAAFEGIVSHRTPLTLLRRDRRLTPARSFEQTDASSPFPVPSSHLPPTLFLGPISLPKACLVEWQVSLHTGRPANPIEPVYTDDDEDPEVKPPRWEAVDAGRAGEWEEGIFEEGEARWGAGVFEDLGESRL